MPSMPPRRLITTRVLPPGVPPKEACIIASPNIWVIARPPPRAAPVLSRVRRDKPVRADLEKSGQPQAGDEEGVVVVLVIAIRSSGRHVVGRVEQGRRQAGEQPAGQG